MQITFKATRACLLVQFLFAMFVLYAWQPEQLVSPAYAAKKLMLPPVFGDHMVVQRDKPIVVSGKAVAGAAVQVDVAGTIAATIADAKGKWRVVAPARSLGTPFTITVSSTGETVAIRDVLAGDVYLCAGQSNMLLPAAVTSDCRHLNTLKSASTRFFNLSKGDRIDLFFNSAKEANLEGSTEKEDYFDGEGFKWINADDPEIENRSAVAAAFAYRLRQLVSDDIPIGIVQCTIGGTNIQSWIPTAEVPEKYVDTKTSTPVGYVYEKYLAPMAGLNFKAVLWYQGESDVERFTFYPRLFAIMTQQLRKRFSPDMSFFIIQLPNWGAKGSIFPSLTAYFREAQQKASMVPNCFLVPTINSEITDYAELHSSNKLTVGHNAAQMVAGQIYKIEHALTPRYATVERVGPELKVTFSYLDSGLELRGKKFSAFEISGADGQFKPANARLEGDALYLSSALVHEPEHCRYAWSDNSVAALFSKTGMPVSPFRSDLLPLVGNKSKMMEMLIYKKSF